MCLALLLYSICIVQYLYNTLLYIQVLVPFSIRARGPRGRIRIVHMYVADRIS